MVLGWTTLLVHFFLNLAAVNGIAPPVVQATLLSAAVEMGIIVLILAAVPCLLAALRNRPKSIRRSLIAGGGVIATGAILAGIRNAYVLAITAVVFLGNQTFIPQFSALNEFIRTFGELAEIVGWALCGAGCIIVAQSYFRCMQKRVSFRRIFLLVAAPSIVGAIVLTTVAVLAIRMEPGVKPRSVVEENVRLFAYSLWYLATIVLVLVGALNMWRLRRGVRTLLEENQRTAPCN
ncbi:MAG: hypothetical protein K8R92_07750 [Planctomycetes bacterium]|nr:hypothetical protein [Planctomycetota bacterium]